MTSEIEKGIQAVLAAIAIAILLWVGNTLLEIKNEVAIMKVQVIAQRDALVMRMQRLEEDIEILRRQHDPYYERRRNGGPGDR